MKGRDIIAKIIAEDGLYKEYVFENKWIVDEYVDDLLVDSKEFRTKRQAINYVSGEYTYYFRKYVETEKFNVATTLTKSIDQIDYENNENETCYCEPFDDDLMCAYIDEWDNVLKWIIREKIYE